METKPRRPKRKLEPVSKDELAQIEHLIDYSCNAFGITRDGFFENQWRMGSVATIARKLVVALAQRYYDVSLSTLGSYFGRSKTPMAQDRKMSSLILDGQSGYDKVSTSTFRRAYTAYRPPEQQVLVSLLHQRGGRDPRSMKHGVLRLVKK